MRLNSSLAPDPWSSNPSTWHLKTTFSLNSEFHWHPWAIQNNTEQPSDHRTLLISKIQYNEIFMAKSMDEILCQTLWHPCMKHLTHFPFSIFISYTYMAIWKIEETWTSTSIKIIFNISMSTSLKIITNFITYLAWLFQGWVDREKITGIDFDTAS